MNLTAVRKQRDEIIRQAAGYGARNVRIFGSVARDEATAESDLDLLVEMESGRSLLDLVALCQDLEELLGCSVDVVTDNGISPHLQRTVLAEAVRL